MRKLSAAALAAINLPNPKFVLFAKVELATITIFATSSPYDIYFNGDTYTSDAGVVGFGPPRVSNSVDREIYELIFLDHADIIQAELRAGINGKLLTVYAAFFDENGLLLLNPADVLIAYRGFIDTGKIVNDGSNKQAILSAASPMASLDSIGGYIVSKDGMDQVSSTDTSFDDVYVGGKTVNLKWGKR